MSENEMLCKTCKRWADGWCLAQQMGMSSNKVCNAWELSPVVDWVSEKDALNKRIAELEEFKTIVEGCGFEVITEPPVLNHPERKILKGHGTIYVPELPEPPEVQK